MEIEKLTRRRRHHPEEFKQAVIAACCEPGASVAGIAMVNGVNANQVRRWMRERGFAAPTQRVAISPAAEMSPAFIPVALAPAAPESAAIRVEIRRGNTAVQIDWPTDAAGACATRLRDWLR